MHAISGRPSPFRSAIVQAASFIDVVTLPLVALRIFSAVNINAMARTAVARDHIVLPVSVEIAGPERMAVNKRIVNYVAGPCLALCKIDDNLVPMPWLD